MFGGSKIQMTASRMRQHDDSRPMTRHLYLIPLVATVISAGCFVTTDENLWRQKRDAAEASVGDSSVASEAAAQEAAADGQGDVVQADVVQTDVGHSDLPKDTLPPDAPIADTGKLPLGASCTAAGDCGSGYCVDLVCCSGACTGPCKACNSAGAEGTCTPAIAGIDPEGDCTTDPVTSCGQDGTCDGNGACRKYAAGVVCGVETCFADDKLQFNQCDGLGSCVPGGESSCVPYKCDPTTNACYTSCTSDAQCSLYRCNTSTSKCYSSCATVAECQPGYKCIGLGKCK